MKEPKPFFPAAPLVAALALLSLVPAVSAAEGAERLIASRTDSPSRPGQGRSEAQSGRPGTQVAVLQRAMPALAGLPTNALRREIAEEEFAAHVAKLGPDPAKKSLSAAVEFAAQEARIVRLVIRRPQWRPAVPRRTRGLRAGLARQPGPGQPRRRAPRVVLPARLRHPCRGAPQRRPLRQRP